MTVQPRGYAALRTGRETEMTTPQREQIAKQLLGRVEAYQHHASKPTGAKPTRRHKHPHRLPAPTPAELEEREQGWNDRFFRDTPPQQKRPTRPHKSCDAEPNTQAERERKIRQERRQYGKGDSHNKSGPGRLKPIESLPPPPRQEPVNTSVKEEKLRFNVLKAIDSRETFIYQLNALILCTPVQEDMLQAPMPAPSAGTGVFMPLKPRATMALALSGSGCGGGSMSNAREATRLALQLASDLQMTGIQVVEGIVEWMLEAGAHADTPPQFVWRGQNYFQKMISDLDFAGPELRARGVALDCFSLRNPLCIRPDQKLGRVLAAHSIIREMVDMDQQQTRVLHAEEDVRELPTSHASTKAPVATNLKDDNSDPASTPSPRYHSADEMILQCSTEDDTYVLSSRSATSQPVSATVSCEHSGKLNVQCADEAKELVDMLEDSFCEVRSMPITTDDPKSETMAPYGTSSTKSTARDEYDNSFEDDAEDNNNRVVAEDSDCVQQGVEKHRCDPGPPEHQDEAEHTDATDVPEQHESSHSIDDSDHQFAASARLFETISERGFCPTPQRLQEAASQTHSLQEDLRQALLRDKPSLRHVFDGSLLDLLEPVLNNRTASLRTTAALAANQSSHAHVLLPLLAQSSVVMDQLCEHLARNMERELERSNPLISEIGIEEIAAAAEAVWSNSNASQWLRRATDVLLTSTNGDTKPVGVCRLLRVFYPYLMNQPRDRLVHGWDQISGIFKTIASVDFGELVHVLDATCRALILNVVYLRRLREDNASIDVSAKLTIVCNRGNVLDASVSTVHKKWLSDATSSPSHQIFPFYESPFGEKVVDGTPVEEGEGRGPLKEWFVLVAEALAAKWHAVEIPFGRSNDFDPVLVNGNKLVVDRMADVLEPGYKVEWLSGESTITRVINSCDRTTGAYMLDRGGLSNDSFALSELRLYRPCVPYLQYVQSSESYWLNGALDDSPGNRQALEFVGWFLANAIVHHCSLHVRIHSLVFELMLDDQRVVAMSDLQGLDASLYSSLTQLKFMKPAEFASYLEFEGVEGAASLSVDDYIDHTLNQLYGPNSSIAWQRRALQRGFFRVYDAADLTMSAISASDIAELLSGRQELDADFDIQRVFRISMDQDFTSCPPLRESFWEAVNGFNANAKRQLVKFITGVDTLPQVGTEFLRIEMPFPSLTAKDHEKALRMLPQSHTCDNTLELPNYWRALCWKHTHDTERENAAIGSELVALLSEKLRLAAEYSSGYGLDATKAASGGASLAGILPRRSTGEGVQASGEESYESLDLPALGDGSVDDRCRGSESEQRDPELGRQSTPTHPSGADAGASSRRDDDEYGADDFEEEELAA